MKETSRVQRKIPKNGNSLWPGVPTTGTWVVLNGIGIPFVGSTTAGV